MPHYRRVLAMLLFAAGSAVPVSATTVYLRPHNSSGPYGMGLANSDASVLGTISGGTFEREGTVVFDLDMSSTAAFTVVDRITTYCVEPTQSISASNISPSAPFEVVALSSAGFTTQQVDLLQRLWANAFQASVANSPNNPSLSARAAAFQFIVWDIISDVPTSPLHQVNLSAGLIRMHSSSDDKETKRAYNQAQTWVQALNSGSWTTHEPDMVVLRSAGIQDLITDFQTPEPRTCGLLASGLGLLGLVRARLGVRTK
jgi:hypothetical protein